MSWKKRSGSFRLPAASSLRHQATLNSSDGLILPQAWGAHNCANSFDFIAEYEMVAVVDGPDSSSTFRHATVRSAQFLNAQAEANAFAFAHPTSRQATPSRTHRQANLSEAVDKVVSYRRIAQGLGAEPGDCAWPLPTRSVKQSLRPQSSLGRQPISVERNARLLSL